MTAALAAVARMVLGVVLVLTATTAVFWPVFGPQGFWTLVWLAVTFAVVTGAVLGLAALAPRKAVTCGCPCRCPVPGQRDDDGAAGWCDPCRMNIHQEA